MKLKHLISIGGLATALLLAGCGGGGGIGGTGAPMGTLGFSITDAPACGYDAVKITIEKIRVHQSATAADSDAGWSDIVLTPARRIDLLGLTNGVLEELGQTAVPAGTYTQLRLVLANNGPSAPFANAVIPTGGAETALTTPSAQQSGLKLNANMEVPAGQRVDFVLDFDACKSVVKAGNSGNYNLKPVISVIPRLAAAGLRVEGYLDPAIALTSNVSLQTGGRPVKATPADATGKFVLYPVPAGSYDLVVVSAGHVTAVMTGVPVSTTTVTVVNSTTARISPASSVASAVAGTVTPTTATVRALQTLSSGGPPVEVAWAPVNAATGRFDFSLAPGAPMRAAYTTNPLTVTFSVDAAAAGRYRLDAELNGSVLPQAVDLNTPPVGPVTFIFP
jgi:Domain of unknown function (DUF4382)